MRDSRSTSLNFADAPVRTHGRTRVPPLTAAAKPAAMLLALALAGCASVPADQGRARVGGLLAERDARLAASAPASAPIDLQAQLDRLLAEPLTPERALGVALLSSPRVRLAHAQLGLAQADWLEASRLSNPALSLSAMDSDEAGARTRIGFGLVQDFTDLLFLRTRRGTADIGLEQAQAQTAAALQALAADVMEHWYALAGAQQIAQMRAAIAEAASTSADLADRFHTAGNLSPLARARERADAEQAQLEAEAADAQAQAARIALHTQLGLPMDRSWTLAEGLPLPVSQESALRELLDLGQRQRLDLLALRGDLSAVESTLALARTLRWVPFLEVGIEGERETDGARLLGPTLSIELPLFGHNQGGALRTQALLDHTRAQIQAMEGEIARDVAAAYARLGAARARVERHRKGLIPQREAIVARLQELQNYMLVGQFELLLAKQEEYAAYEGYLTALQDYWLARVALARAVGGALPSDARIGPAEVTPIRLSDLPAADSHAAHRRPEAVPSAPASQHDPHP